MRNMAETAAGHIRVNGEERPVDGPLTVADLVASLDMTQRRIAVEINGRIVVRSGFAHTVIVPGDRVEIVVAVGGG